MTDNLSLVLYDKNDLRLEQRPIPTPGRGQVLIRVSTVGICGSDVHYVKDMRCGPFLVHDPMVLGHETSGVVAEIGEGVTGLEKGDRVALEPGVPCRRCSLCKKGLYNLCTDVNFFATPPYDGTLTRYVVHEADFCFKLPPHVTMEEGALLEPFSVAVHACGRAGVTVGQNVLVLGAGPIGILNMLTAKASGASKVVMTDIDQGRLEQAKRLGADQVVNVQGKAVVDVRSEILSLLKGEQPDVSIECTGAASAIETGIVTTRSGGVLALVGLGALRVELPLIEAACREVDIRGVFRYANRYKAALELVASKKVDLSILPVAHYKLEEAKEAFARFDKADVIKVFIHCD